MRPRRSIPQNRRRPTERLATASTLGRKHRPDYWILIWSAALLAIGLVVVYAISPALAATHNVGANYYVSHQMLAIGLSLVAFIATSQIPLAWWRQIYKPLIIFAAFATLLALVLPVNPAYPAHRWVRLGSFSFQSVEVVKFAMLIWLAGFLALRLREGTVADTKRTLQPVMLAFGAIALVIAGVQSDLGSTGVIVAMIAAMTFVAGLPLGRIALIGSAIVLLLVLAVSSTPYRRERLQAFLHPESNCQTTGYQACQALISVGSGGVIGLGLGSSVQAYGYQPEAANDSIFAIYAEKFGFFGSVALLAVFVAFFSRLKQVAERLDDDFTRLLVVGVLVWFSTQAFINIGGMVGLLPLKGITLPFISYGGTSVVFAAAAVGLAFQASQYTSFSTPRAGQGRDQSGSADRNFRNNTLRRPAA